MKTTLPNNHIVVYACLVFALCAYNGVAQTITRDDGNNSSTNFVCPGLPTAYTLNTANTAYTNCFIKWSATGGEIVGPDNSRNVSVRWQDTPGTMAQLSCSLTGCIDSNGKSISGTTVSFVGQLVLSVNGQAFSAPNNPVSVDYCNTTTVKITVPHMYVQGTGGIAQPPLQEVVYSWTLPAGWYAEGNVTNTSLNGITIHPSACAAPGNVQVVGVINDRCGSAGASASTNISLSGINPTATITVPQGYLGSTACNTTPVTLTAFVNPSLGCVTSYQWTQFPAGWTFVSQSGNTATFKPSGTSADSDPNKPFKVAVKFKCGTTILSGGYNPAYNPPSIAGPAIICTTGQFAVANTSVGINWSTNNSGLSFNSTGLATRMYNYNGITTVTASLVGCSTPITLTKAVRVGTYTHADYSIIESRMPVTGGTQYLYGLGSWMINDASASYNWSWRNYSYVSGQGTRVVNLKPIGTSGGYVGLSISNACGWSDPAPMQFFPYVAPFAAIASPNPVAANTHISLKVTPLSDSLNVLTTPSTVSDEGELHHEPTIMSLYDFHTGTMVRQWTYNMAERNYQLNIAGIKSGTYVLRIGREGWTEATKIIIE